MQSSIEVTAASRLHFGMLSFGQARERQYGGVGVMVDKPGLKLRISPAAAFDVSGLLAERARRFAEQACSALDLPCEPECHIEILCAPPEHVGLGTGTQLGLSVAAGLNAFLQRETLEPVVLARMVSRGERSAIGTYGFCRGGLLVESGKREGDLLSPLVARVELPVEWRFLLVCLADEAGLSGTAEQTAFRDLPPVPSAATATLCREVLLSLLPAAVEGHFEEFSASLYRYGHMAGLSFAPNQGGPFASQRIANLVNHIREIGVQGVGQSSWGPVVFALLPDTEAAERLEEILREDKRFSQATFFIAKPAKRGARIHTSASSERR